MTKLVMTKGLPGSGKSTWAKEQLKHNGNWKRVNKDELRAMIDDGKWSGANEKFVVQMRDAIIIAALQKSISIISDDTNLDPKHEERFRQLARENGASLVIEDQFLQVSLDECIKRDLNRLNSVGAKVIRDMYKKYLEVTYEPPVWDDSLPTAIMCDLDGTLALIPPGKNPYKRDFINDGVDLAVEATLRLYMKDNYKILLTSAREDTYRSETEAWLDKNHIEYDELIMRVGGDTRNDSIVKEEMYREEIEGKYNVLFVMDDRNRVVDLWRRLGLKCFQVAPGDF